MGTNGTPARNWPILAQTAPITDHRLHQWCMLMAAFGIDDSLVRLGIGAYELVRARRQKTQTIEGPNGSFAEFCMDSDFRIGKSATMYS